VLTVHTIHYLCIPDVTAFIAPQLTFEIYDILCFDFVQSTKTCKKVSIGMLIKTSTDFCLLDEEGIPEMLQAVSTRW